MSIDSQKLRACPGLGYRPEKLPGVSVLALIRPDDVEEMVSSTFQLRTTSYVTNGIPYWVKAAEGSYRWLESSRANMSDDRLIGASWSCATSPKRSGCPTNSCSRKSKGKESYRP